MIKERLINCLFLMLAFNVATSGQTYDDYLGAGHEVGIQVTSSGGLSDSTAHEIISGTDQIPDFTGAARFLAQAGFGGSYEDIEYVSQIGIENWIEEQIEMPYTTYSAIYDDVYNGILARMDTSSVPYTPDSLKRYYYQTFTFFHKLFTEEDMLRQKMAFALSQIFVIAYDGNDSWLKSRGDGYAAYYDLLYEGGFGNFHDLLHNIALNPIMGRYLSHWKNKKNDPILGTQPDENFAREIMQLFSIGLVELNNDGTIKLDICGEPIPTYNINDVQEMAKVFTGLSAGAIDTIRYPTLVNNIVSFTLWEKHVDYAIPMAMYQDEHETSSKVLFNGDLIIQSNQTGEQDIEDAIDYLFNHPNVGPFISIRLIQQFVKSNPTPAYINRVATVFNNNGNNVRGDLGAVILSILTDPEARDCEWINDPKGGKLLQPLERYLNLFKALELQTPSNNYLFNDGNGVFGEFRYIQQAFLSSPSVFNFFSPFYAESEYVAPDNMVSPEFQILNSVTAIYYLNRIELAIKDIANQYHTHPYKNFTAISNIDSYGYMQPNQNWNDKPILNFTPHIDNYQLNGISALIDELDLVLCRGQLHPEVKNFIEINISDNLANNPNFDAEDIVKEVLYYIMMSPSYAILK